MNRLKAHIDEKLRTVELSGELAEKIIEAAAGEAGGARRSGCACASGRRRVRRRIAAAVLAACLCAGGTATALAAGIPAVNDWVYAISPQLAERLYPIREAAEDNGIRLEVLYGANDDHTAVVYFSIRDLEGGRVDGSTDIYNYDMRGPYMFNCRQIAYDEELRTAYFRMEGTGGRGMAGRMETFRVASFLSNKSEYDWFDTGQELWRLAGNGGQTEAVSIDEYYYSGGSAPDEEDFRVLKPDQTTLSLGEDIGFVTVSGVGFVDGKLHIQTKWAESVDNHGMLCLVKAGASPEDREAQVPYDNYYFMTDSDTRSGDARSTHIEFVYDVGPDELADYGLWAKLTEDGDYTQGEWQVNFRLDDAAPAVACEVDGVADRVELTPLGIYLSGAAREENEAVVRMKSGESFEIEFFETALFKEPVRLSEVSAVEVNGQAVMGSGSNCPIL